MRTKTISYRRGGKKYNRTSKVSGFICRHCKKSISGRKSPTLNKSSHVVIRNKRTGERRHYHRTCWMYYVQPGFKGEGYKGVRVTKQAKKPVRGRYKTRRRL